METVTMAPRGTTICLGQEPATNQTCPICLEQETEEHPLKPTGACSHAFHDACIRPWENRKTAEGAPTLCPLCRAVIVAKPCPGSSRYPRHATPASLTSPFGEQPTTLAASDLSSSVSSLASPFWGRRLEYEAVYVPEHCPSGMAPGLHYLAPPSDPDTDYDYPDEESGSETEGEDFGEYF